MLSQSMGKGQRLPGQDSLQKHLLLASSLWINTGTVTYRQHMHGHVHSVFVQVQSSSGVRI